MKCRKITACLLALLLTCSAVASCTGGGTSDVTATGTDTGSATESATVVATDRATDTERGSESESETAPIPAVKENVPTSGASVTFYHNENNSLFLTAEGLDAAVTEDAEVGTVLSLRAAGGSEHTLTLNYGEYVRAHGLEPATVGGTQYVILRFRVENGDAASLRLGTATEAVPTIRPMPAGSRCCMPSGTSNGRESRLTGMLLPALRCRCSAVHRHRERRCTCIRSR